MQRFALNRRYNSSCRCRLRGGQSSARHTRYSAAGVILMKENGHRRPVLMRPPRCPFLSYVLNCLRVGVSMRN